MRLSEARELSIRGADALERRRIDDALVLFSDALARSPEDERAQWGMARALWSKGERARAIQHMNRAVQLTTTKTSVNADYLVQLGQMYLEVGDTEQARTQAIRALDHDRRHADAWALLGSVEQTNQNWPAALEDYERALLLRPDFPRVQLAVSEVYRQLNRPHRALATLDKMADLHPTEHPDPELLLMRGLALADLGRNEEAIVALNSSSDRLPSTSPKLRFQLASAQYQLGDPVRSRMTLGRLLKDHPNNVEAIELQAKLDRSFEHMARPTDETAPIYR